MIFTTILLGYDFHVKNPFVPSFCDIWKISARDSISLAILSLFRPAMKLSVLFLMALL